MKLWQHAALLLALTFTACDRPGGDNRLSSQEEREGWKLLFDGRTTNGWHVYNKGQVPSAWTVQNGALVCVAGKMPEVADLVTDESFENYELRFDWKISKEGNSGVFINVVERPDIVAAWASGPEYQLLETTHHDFSIPTKRSGCLYSFYGQATETALKPAEEWNESRIVQQNGKVEFYLNGQLTAKEDFTSQAWRDTVAHTHFAKYPVFGVATKGRIALQDWSKEASFKNIKIKSL